MDAEIDRELAFHFDQLVREQIEEGLLPGDARREARRLLGDRARLRDWCRDERRVGWLEDARLDAGYALRTLIKDPVFTMAVVLSVALGAGATAAVLVRFAAGRGRVMGEGDYNAPVEPVAGEPAAIAEHLAALADAGAVHAQLVLDPITIPSIREAGRAVALL